MRTRNKTKTTTSFSALSIREYNGAGIPPAWTVITPLQGYGWTAQASSMTDDFGPKSKVKSQAVFRDCTHVHSYVSHNASLDPDEVLTGRFPRSYGELVVQTKGSVSRKLRSILIGGSASALSYPAGGAVDLDSFASLAKSAMMPALSDGSSLLSFVYELKDFKRIGVNLLALAHTRGLKAAGILGPDVFWSLWGSIPWDSKPRKISKAYLAWRFAWAPFVADCTRLLNKLIAYKQKIRQFIRRQKQRQQRYYGKTVPVTFPGGSFGVGTFTPPESASLSTLYANVETGYVGFCTRRQEVGEPKARLSAVMRYSYTLPGSVSSMEGQINAFLDVLGINANPAVIWNAIPFSFVVDWFINVGGFLERLRVDNIRAATTVTKFCVSARFERNFITGVLPYMMRTSTQTPLWFPEKGVLVRAVRYERKGLNPESIGIWLTPGAGLTGDKLSLATALAHANAPQRRQTFARNLYMGMQGGVSPTVLLKKAWGEESR